MIFQPITDDQWARMPWHAKQRWLLTANTLRKHLAAEIDARLAVEASRAAHTAGLAVDLPPDPEGECRLWLAVREVFDMPLTEVPQPRNARRLDIDRIAEILEENPRATARIIAAEFGVSPEAVRKACKRHERPDLVAQLARNAAVAA